MLLFPLFFFPFKPSSVLIFASLCFAFSSPSPPVLEWNSWLWILTARAQSSDLQSISNSHAWDTEGTPCPKLYVSAYVMDQGGGLCPSDIWAPKSETSETPVVVELEALTGSCLTLSSFRNHSPIPRSLAQKPVSCLQTAESLAFQQGPICRWYTHLAPERAAWITRVSNRSSEAKSSQTAHLAHLRGGYRDIRPKSLPSASVPRSQGHAE